MPELLDRLQSALADRYRLERELGAGGMATVYLAHDLRHGRRVALKLLKPELAAVIGAERFLGEIRTTANLQHPHILPLFDSGAADSFLYYVMPYVEGESLRARLSREKQLPIGEAVRLGSEVASALDYAHRHGVIHRDIKPENILLHEGTALVADFGIALAVSSAGRNRLTETGLSIGTPQYMSPEQAMGDRDLDARSDIYSLGAVLYEMLVGDPPFLGSTAQAIVAKVITERPTPITAARDTVPPALAATVHRALAKLPADRFSTAAELGEALAGRGTTAISGATAVIEPQPRPTARRWVPLAGWALFAIAAAGLAVLASRQPSLGPDRAPVRFSVELDSTAQLMPGDPAPAISSDGRRILIQGVRDNHRVVLVRDLARNEIVTVPGSEDGYHPFLSPDGEWIAFASEGKLRKVRAEGGSPIALAPSFWGGGTWGPDGTIVYTESYNGGLWRVNAGGGEPTRLTTPDSAAGELAHWWPNMLPDGHHLIFTNFSTPIERAKIELLDLRTGARTVLVRGGVGGAYAASGHLVYGAGDALLAVPFDLKRLRVTGEAVPVVTDVALAPSNGEPAFSISSSGDLAYVRASVINAPTVVEWVSRDGRAQPLLTQPGRYASPAISPDGRRVALTVTARDGHRDVWAYEPARDILTRITSGDAAEFNPLWTRDGRRLIYSSERPIFDLFTRAEGAGTPESALVVSRADKYAGSLSPDGTRLLYNVSGKTAEEIWSVGLNGHGAPAPLLQGRFNLRHASVSPAGEWLAFESDESGGRSEIYLQSYPDLARDRHQVSTKGGYEPRWTRGGRELVYRTSDSLFAVTVDPRTGETGRPTPLFAYQYRPEGQSWSYDVAADGSRFLMVKLPAQSAPRRVEVVLNWFSELKGGTAR
ncbi:MAG TPA: protein kinase [Gemmatimonadales bacterium]|nr:protein kinase [Gemmatimonadales bacterium]